MWQTGEIALDLLDDLTEGSIVTLSFRTPVGVVLAMGSPSVEGTTLVVEGVHVQGFGIGPNSIGSTNLRALAQVVLERLDSDGLIIKGALRTSGAIPGRRPGPLRFTRHRGPSSGT